MNKKTKILIIDDTPAIINQIQETLQREGYEIFAANSGEKALQKITRSKPDLVLLDIIMPGIDGYETCRQIKGYKANKDIPVIFMSALAETFDKVKAFSLGAVDYITKPLNAEELLARIKTHVSISKLQKKLEEANTKLEEKVHERTAELQEKNEEYETLNEELKQTNSELYQAKQYAEENENKLSAITNQANDGISLADIDGNLRFVNPAFCKMTGYSERELLNMSFLNLKADSQPADIFIDGKTIKEGFPFQTILKCKNKTEFYAEIVVRAIKIRNQDFVLGTVRDISKRKQAEEEITWNLAINKALSSLYIPLVTTGTSIEQIANLVLEKSRQLTNSPYGVVAEIDPATGDLIAHTLTRMMGGEWMIAKEELRKICFPKRADGLYNELWDHALNTKEPFYDNTSINHSAEVGIQEGHIAIERFLTVPVLLGGEMVGKIALWNSSQAYTNQDLEAVNRIAEFYALAVQQKRAEEEINKLNQELESRVTERTLQLETANKELEAFAYSVSHDLRAPLRAIDGFSRILFQDYENQIDVQGKDYLERVCSATQRMGQLIDDMLLLSRINRREMTFQDVNLSKQVAEIAENCRKSQPDRKVVFIVPENIIVRGDRRLLRIVLENLINNAWKFTSKKASATIEFGMLKQEDKYAYFIRDNGVGFDMKYANKLFGAFQRLHDLKEYPGTGVGLATIQRIIYRHGGKVWAEGKIDKGAMFYFTL